MSPKRRGEPGEMTQDPNTWAKGEWGEEELPQALGQ